MFNIVVDNAYFQHKDQYDAKSDYGFKHNHKNLELHYIIKGSGTINIEGASTNVQGCDLIIIPAFTYHVFEVNKEQKYERIILNFPMDMFPDINYGEFFDKPKILNLASHHQIIDIFERIIYLEKFSDKEEDFKKLITLNVQELLLVLKNTSFDNGISKTVNELTSKIICYIDDHIFDPLRVDDIAKALYVSKSHLQNTFIASMKIGIKAYIIIKKMNKAHMMLQEGQRATDVANELGYTTYSCFYKSYVKVFGQKPKSTKN